MCRGRVSRDGGVSMNRRLLVGMFGLLLGGCIQTQSSVPVSQRGPRVPPVGLTPMPNIYEAINRENPRIDPRSLHPEYGPVLAHLDDNRSNGAGAGPGAG